MSDYPNPLEAFRAAQQADEARRAPGDPVHPVNATEVTHSPPVDGTAAAQAYAPSWPGAPDPGYQAQSAGQLLQPANDRVPGPQGMSAAEADAMGEAYIPRGDEQ